MAAGRHLGQKGADEGQYPDQTPVKDFLSENLHLQTGSDASLSLQNNNRIQSDHNP